MIAPAATSREVTRGLSAEDEQLLLEHLVDLWKTDAGGIGLRYRVDGIDCVLEGASIADAVARLRRGLTVGLNLTATAAERFGHARRAAERAARYTVTSKGRAALEERPDPAAPTCAWCDVELGGHRTALIGGGQLVHDEGDAGDEFGCRAELERFLYPA